MGEFSYSLTRGVGNNQERSLCGDRPLTLNSHDLILRLHLLYRCIEDARISFFHFSFSSGTLPHEVTAIAHAVLQSLNIDTTNPNAPHPGQPKLGIHTHNDAGTAIARFQLADYKVRILDGNAGTAAKTRVLVESSNGQRRWTTVGVSTNILDASYQAVVEGIEYGPML